ncbi:MAG: DUF3795 domain-containing protein [Candidatus Lokiarchaeota archaeon]|nr:DUF3795 domain-containing protein [Candidatus Lokiarchaeota archaeon]
MSGRYCYMSVYYKDHAPCGIYCKTCPGVKAYGCRGCREEKGQIKDFPVCKTYECVTEKGINFCYECKEFPCERLQPIVNFEIFLPHNSKVYNSVMMKKLGIVKWNDMVEEKMKLYYQAKKVKYGGDPLTLEKKDESMYKKKSNKE